MPNLVVHIDLALQVAALLDHHRIRDNLACFLLGSTAPDIRAITKHDRSEYHFASLDFDDVGTGVENLFKSYPDLVNHQSYNGPTVAFLAGYITHIISDEIWIKNVYREYFGNRKIFEDPVIGNVMDRAMQLLMDKKSWAVFDDVRHSLAGTTDDIQLPFITQSDLEKWANWVIEVGDRGFSWERIKFMANRIAQGDQIHPAHQIAEQFINEMPDSIEFLYTKVPAEYIEDYSNDAKATMFKQVERYLK